VINTKELYCVALDYAQVFFSEDNVSTVNGMVEVIKLYKAQVELLNN